MVRAKARSVCSIYFHGLKTAVSHSSHGTLLALPTSQGSLEQHRNHDLQVVVF